MKTEKIKKEVLDFLFPLECLGCGQENVYLCKKCFASIPFKTEQSCVFCRRPVADGLTCHHCTSSHFLDQCLSAGDYTDPLLAKLIKTCKYKFAQELIPLLADFILIFLEKNFFAGSSPLQEKNVFLIPIPLHKKRLNWRGFNQSELLAAKLAKKYDLEILPGLSKIKNNPPQAKLEEEKRRSNLSGCFSWTGPALNNKKIILIDDVATTGATLDEAARTLKKVGAHQVIAITAAGG